MHQKALFLPRSLSYLRLPSRFFQQRHHSWNSIRRNAIFFRRKNRKMWRLIFPILGAVLFGAHLYFWANYLLLPIPLILLILLFIPFRPVCWIWQISLLCFGVEWLLSAYQLYLRRVAEGMPFALGVSILTACGLLTMLSVLVFSNTKIKRHYPLQV